MIFLRVGYYPFRVQYWPLLVKKYIELVAKFRISTVARYGLLGMFYQTLVSINKLLTIILQQLHIIDWLGYGVLRITGVENKY